MTITAQTSKTGPYSGNGTTTVFSYTFEVQDEAHLVVTLADATGVETVQVLNTDYTVSGVGNANGGQITMSTAPAVSYTLTISRNIPITQEVDLENRRSVAPEVLEDAYDKLTQIAQDLSEQVGRAIKTGISTPSPNDLPNTDRAGQFLAFDALGNPTYASGSGGDAALRSDLASSDAGKGSALIKMRADDGSSIYRFKNVVELLADTALTYPSVSAGDIIRTRAEGFSYEVAASGATNQDLTTAGGVKLYGVNGALPILDGGTASHSDGTDTLSSSTRYFIGNNAPSTDDSGLLIGRGITGSYVSGAHAVRDESSMSMTGTGLLAYASFDAIPSMSGAVNYNHLRGFQSRPGYNGSATIDEVSGYQTQITHSGVGVITEAYGLRVDPTLVPSGGFVSTHYALFVGDLEASGAVGAGYAIYSGFTNISSYHGGLFQFGTAPQIAAAGFTTFGAILSHDASGNLVTNPNLTIINGVLDMKNATTSKVQASASLKLELDAVGIVEAQKPLQMPVYTVATLPSPANAYAYCRAFVSDANATTFNSVVAGGGANKVPVFCDGTDWRIG